METRQVQAIHAFESELRTTVDPLPVSILGMLLFLASEAMFFVGLLGAFIVLKSAGDQREIFTQSAKMLSSAIAIASIALLVVSSVSMWKNQSPFHWIAVLAGLAFLLLQCQQWRLMEHSGFGASRDNYCGIYFLITSVHWVHLVIGIVAVLWFKISQPKELPEGVQIYWHFVNAAGVFCIVALYWI